MEAGLYHKRSKLECSGLDRQADSWDWGGRAGSIVPRWGAACCAPTRFVRGYGAAEIHHRTRAMMRQPELLPRTTAWYSRFSDSRISNLG
jgi:hypothetical protein